MKIFKLISSNADIEWVFIDGSHVWAHQHSTRIKNQDISKSIGGNSSKIHLVVGVNGNPIEIIISNGTADIKIVPKLIEKLDLNKTEVVCADKGYDSKTLREQISTEKTKENIPRKSNI